MTGRSAAPSARAVVDLAAAEGVALPWRPVAVDRIGEHASSRRFYRLTAPAGAAARAASLVLVVHPPDDDEGARRYAETAAWLEAAGVRVPTVLGQGPRLVLVEDVGDLLLDAQGLTPGARRRGYRQAVAVVEALQSRGRRVDLPGPRRALGRDRLLAELEFMERHTVQVWLGQGGGHEARQAVYGALAAAAAALPVAACHRDFHARNLALRAGRLVVLDFQDLMWGPVLYDLASLAWDNYRDVSAPAGSELLGLWWQGARPALRRALEEVQGPGLGTPPGGCPPGLPPGPRRAYCLVAAQRHLKALGTFGYQVTAAGRPGFARFAPRTWGHARRALAGLGWAEALDALRPLERLADRDPPV